MTEISDFKALYEINIITLTPNNKGQLESRNQGNIGKSKALKIKS